MNLKPGARYAIRDARLASCIILVLILLLAFFLRVVILEAVPPGPRFDEILVFMETDRIHAGSRLAFSADIYEETLFHYILTGAEDLLGKRLIVGRWLAAALDMLAIATLYPLARRAFGRRVALLAVALTAVGFWPVLYSRFAIRITCMLPFVTAGVYLFWRGIEQPAGQVRRALRDHRALRDLILAGLCLGVGVYTYGVGRYAPVLFVLFAIYLLIADRQLFRKRLVPIGIALLIVAAMDAPLLAYLQAHPGVDQRFSQVSAPLDALLQGDPRMVIEHAWRTLTMAVWRGDPEWLYNFSGRPVFDPITGVLFYGGAVVCIAGWRMRWRGAMLAWLGLGMGQAALTWPPASFSHTVTAQPVFYVLPAVGTVYILDRLPGVLRVPYSVFRILFIVVAFIALVGINLGLTVRDYFGAWPAQPQVRTEYQASLTALARRLESDDLPPAVAGGASVDMWNPSNSYGFGLIYRRPDRPVAWYNPTGALAWPPNSGPMTIALPCVGDAAPAPAVELSSRFLDGLRLVRDEKWPDGSCIFQLYEARGRQALDERLAALGTQPISLPGGTQTVTTTVDLADRFTLLGYEVLSDTVGPGQTLSVIVYWETRQSFWDGLVAFTHLIGPDGKLYAQADRLDVFTDSLYPGLAFAQLHCLQVPANAPAGRYHIQVGMYRQADQSRLPVLVNGQNVADAVWLREVTVEK